AWYGRPQRRSRRTCPAVGDRLARICRSYAIDCPCAASDRGRRQAARAVAARAEPAACRSERFCHTTYWRRQERCDLCVLRASLQALACFSRALVRSPRYRGNHSRLRIAFLLSRGSLLSRQLSHALVIGVIMVAAIMPAVRAQNLFERLVTPGPVVGGHAKLEKDCSNCHAPFSRQSQTRLCLACHKETAADRQSSKRFHGRQTDAAKQECTYCHTDHKGRDADIVLLDREIFNHASTNFELRDAHKAVPCDGCHAQNAKFRDAPGRCF